MSLTKAPKKTMREYYLKAPASGSTTAYICRQAYDRTQKRTVQTLVASFNIATDPASPEVNITDKGRSVGYLKVPDEHLAEVQKWLKKNGTFGRVKVPARVLAQVRAEVEAKVRAELNASKVERARPAPKPVAVPVPAPAQAPENESSEAKLVRLLRSIEAACDEVSALMPMDAQHFSKGHKFSEQTINQVRRVWFKSADAIAALNGRTPLKRPKNWEPMREEVFRMSR